MFQLRKLNSSVESEATLLISPSSPCLVGCCFCLPSVPTKDSTLTSPPSNLVFACSDFVRLVLFGFSSAKLTATQAQTLFLFAFKTECRTRQGRQNMVLKLKARRHSAQLPDQILELLYP